MAWLVRCHLKQTYEGEVRAVKRRAAVIGGVLALATLSVGIGVAFGTPGLGGSTVYTARGTVGSATDQIVLGTPRTVTVTRTVRVKTKQGMVRARVKVQVPGIRQHIACGATPCDMVFQVLTIQPGGYTGWHTHPGFLVSTELTGTLTKYGTDCSSQSYAPGQSWTETGASTFIVKNETNADASDIVTFIVDLIIPAAIAKWALLAPIFIPLFIRLGVTPQTVLAAYRVGDSPFNVITPLMAYFPLIVVFAQRYKKDAGIGTVVSLMLSYVVILSVLWTAFFVIWYLIGIPLGPGSPVHI